MPELFTPEELLISMVPQVLFDTAVQKLAAQGAKCIDAGCCRYRMTVADGEEHRCAAGHCFSEKALAAITEESKLLRRGLRVVFDTLVLGGHEKLPDGARQVLFALQDAHDTAESRDDLIRKLGFVAWDCHLLPDAVQQYMGQGWEHAGTW